MSITRRRLPAAPLLVRPRTLISARALASDIPRVHSHGQDRVDRHPQLHLQLLRPDRRPPNRARAISPCANTAQPPTNGPLWTAVRPLRRAQPLAPVRWTRRALSPVRHPSPRRPNPRRHVDGWGYIRPASVGSTWRSLLEGTSQIGKQAGHLVGAPVFRCVEGDPSLRRESLDDLKRFEGGVELRDPRRGVSHAAIDARRGRPATSRPCGEPDGMTKSAAPRTDSASSSKSARSRYVRPGATSATTAPRSAWRRLDRP